MRDGEQTTVDDVLARIERYRRFTDLAGGGVTLTGGEPLLQPALTAEVLRRCKELGLHTALDTSGALGARADDSLLADTDLVLLDIKSFDADVHRRLTGGHLEPSLGFDARLNRIGVPGPARVPSRTEKDRRPALSRSASPNEAVPRRCPDRAVGEGTRTG